MYTQEITRCHRAAIVIAIDQSSSMSSEVPFGNNIVSKAEAVSMVTSSIIDELIMRSHRDNGYRHYFDIALIGYSGEQVYSLLGEDIAFYPITQLANQVTHHKPYSFSCNTLNRGVCEMDDVASIWVKPRAQGATPMYKMLCCVTQLVHEWCNKEENRESFPPLVFNITDGEATDADYDMLRDAALRLKKTGTQDGNTLFVNVHLSPDSNHSSIIFPTTYETPISIRHAHLLMDMSSAIPPQLEGTIIDCRKTYSKGPYVAMSYNTSISEIITVLNIGSRSFVMGL